MGSGSELVELVRSKAGQWRYTNDYPARLDPEAYGGTDCSGLVRWAYGKFGYDVGTWTGDESHAGREIARGHYPSEIPWDEMQPGDLILMTANYWDNYDFDEYLCHIEIYCGDGTMIGHPGGYGPQEKWAQAWMEAYGCITWMVRRVFDDEGEDMALSEDDVQRIARATMLEILCYKNKGINGDNDFYELHSTMLRRQSAADKKLDAIAKDVAALKKAR